MLTQQRRDFLRLMAAGFSATSLSGWFPLLANQREAKSPKSCILLWMPGGPSQVDTFDPKPDHENGGEFKAIQTSVPGIQIGEHLPQVAQMAEHLAIIRSMKTKEGDHGRASYHLRTGYLPAGTIQYPTLGALLGNEFKYNRAGIPNYVSILSNNFLNPAAFGSGFLGPQRSPLLVGGNNPGPGGDDAPEYGAPLEVSNVRLRETVTESQAKSRMELLKFVENQFVKDRPGLPTESHLTAYDQAVQMMNSSAMSAFDLSEEAPEIRDAYGKNRFGQGCLLARRLVERGVPFVEVALGGPNGENQIGWDTHQDNFSAVQALCETLDPAWAMLMKDLQDRGLLESTTIVWMGEFGRTPNINPQTGRDHFPNAWSTVLAGGGIQGGQVYGATNDAGMEVVENPVAVNQLIATVMGAMGIDHTNQNMSAIGRPIRLAEPEVEPIAELLA
ncbi:DUF1501 domain-containing protein [Thalassoglobus polymorphus]|uniref:DUF1501 domain-containing protein n=1 Tax=Thalassoglobus polymorphus TaxID=2527994 RepID=A0A517QUH2_9PLAN|nr:DUF1501 domain-containing protein [Thalassoglobus polymorphus]QDT35289.1 hypothetical protein Mal48_45650 [Thalassoglobus polymorphus]